mmetsp:Transcript_7501/g.8224  ORF Transcript_7501/g.8224 Transcript_7501/m.8224 type:complete len:82 (+) Transcript_7501:1502-1747(+)
MTEDKIIDAMIGVMIDVITGEEMIEEITEEMIVITETVEIVEIADAPVLVQDQEMSMVVERIAEEDERRKYKDHVYKKTFG